MAGFHGMTSIHRVAGFHGMTSIHWVTGFHGMTSIYWVTGFHGMTTVCGRTGGNYRHTSPTGHALMTCHTKHTRHSFTGCAFNRLIARRTIQMFATVA